MPIIDIYPKNKAVQKKLLEKIHRIRKEFGEAVKSKWECEVSDIIVNLHYSTVADADPLAAEVIINVDTTPDKDHEKRAQILRSDLIVRWGRMDLSHFSTEIWIRFFPGSWAYTNNKEVQAKVDHLVPKN